MAKKMMSEDGRKFWLLAIGSLVLGLLFIGCPNTTDGATEITGNVGIAYPQMPAPVITEAKTTDGKYVILSWDGVENVGGYGVVQNQKDKKTRSNISGVSATNGTTYKVDGTTVPNTDTDKWNAKVPLMASIGTAAGQEYRFGVYSSSWYGFDGIQRDSSAVAWGAYYATVAHPANALIGTWVKEGAAEDDHTKFVFEATGNTSSPIRGWSYQQDGTYYATYYANGAELSSSLFSGPSVSFSYNYFTGASINFEINLAGKLIVSGYRSGYGWNADGTYVKQQ